MDIKFKIELDTNHPDESYIYFSKEGDWTDKETEQIQQFVSDLDLEDDEEHSYMFYTADETMLRSRLEMLEIEEIKEEVDWSAILNELESSKEECEECDGCAKDCK